MDGIVSRSVCSYKIVIVTMRTFFIGGNWKLNGNVKLIKEFSNSKEFLSASTSTTELDVVICPAYPYLPTAKEAFAGSAVGVGAQNCHFASSGAFTGEISVNMLEDLEVDWVILGHSERRAIFKETNEIVGKKVQAALASPDMRVIVCIGETEGEREEGITEKFIEGQLLGCENIKEWRADRIVIAYEPVWAIGTGKVATPLQAQEIHAHLRNFLAAQVNPEFAAHVRIIYGGSVNSSNARELAQQPDIDGFLVGGASLKLDEFIKIINESK